MERQAPVDGLDHDGGHRGGMDRMIKPSIVFMFADESLHEGPAGHGRV
ncbi:MAG: hypothetical protein U1F56_11665 [Rubrivivax sp.]